MTSVGVNSETATPLSVEERARFNALLKVAVESPFRGERANALDAARRLAKRHGMSLQEAAREPSPSSRPMPTPRQPERYTAREVADIIAFSEARLRADKDRYERALRDAVERGLDDGARARPGSSGRTGSAKLNGRSRSPQRFAEVLLSETALPLCEIVSLTGLDIYRVVGLKLKMRSAA